MSFLMNQSQKGRGRHIPLHAHAWCQRASRRDCDNSAQTAASCRSPAWRRGLGTFHQPCTSQCQDGLKWHLQFDIDLGTHDGEKRWATWNVLIEVPYYQGFTPTQCRHNFLMNLGASSCHLLGTVSIEVEGQLILQY